MEKLLYTKVLSSSSPNEMSLIHHHSVRTQLASEGGGPVSLLLTITDSYEEVSPQG